MRRDWLKREESGEKLQKGDRDTTLPPFLLHSSTSSPLPSSKEFLLSSYVVREPLIRICLLLSNRVFPLDFLFLDTAPRPSINSTLLFLGGWCGIDWPEFRPRQHPVCYFSHDLPPMIYAVRLQFDEAARELARPCLVVSSDVKTSLSSVTLQSVIQGIRWIVAWFL